MGEYPARDPELRRQVATILALCNGTKLHAALAERGYEVSARTLYRWQAGQTELPSWAVVAMAEVFGLR